MKIRNSLLTLLLFLILVGCTTQPQPVSQAPDALPELPNLLLVSSTGHVDVRRKGGLSFLPAHVGTELLPGDIIILRDGDAAIFCGQEARWEQNPISLEIGQRTGIPCVAGRLPRPFPDTAIVRGRGGEIGLSRLPTNTPNAEDPLNRANGDATLTTEEISETDVLTTQITTHLHSQVTGITILSDQLTILSPRSGWVLNNRPTLVWSEIAGAASYTVTLESDDGITRTIVTPGSPLSYPSDWKPLEADGASYRLIIAAGDKTSGAETPGFSLLEDQDEFTAKVARLQQRVSAEPARTLLLAELYLSRNLRSEAVDLLTALPNANEIIAVQSLLGEIDLNMGLVTQGQAAYTRMAELAEAQGFIESQAQALTGLGWVACALRDLDAVNEQWTQAYDLYTQHSLDAQAKVTQTLFTEIQKRCG